MNFRTYCLSVCAAVLSLAGASAGAAEPGFYVTASLGTGTEDPKSHGTLVGNSEGIFPVEPDHIAVDSGDLAWGVGLGYRVNKYLAAEVEYIDFGTTDIAEHYTVDIPGAPVPFPGPFELTLDYPSKVTGPALSLLGTLPVGENFELFLRGGALFSSRDVGEAFADTVWLAGAGVTWSFAKRWAIRAEFQQTGTLGETLMSGETSVQRVSLSALFRL